MDAEDEARRNPDRYRSGYSDDELITDDKTAIVTAAAFERLERGAGNYDSTFPTGVVPGKMWLRDERKPPFPAKDGKLLLGCYEPHPTTPETHVLTTFRELIVL